MKKHGFKKFRDKFLMKVYDSENEKIPQNVLIIKNICSQMKILINSNWRR